MPGVLAARHGPFTWGPTVAEAVRNAIALEEVARMAFGTLAINPAVEPLASHLLEKHYRRKHGPSAYYGQDPSGRKT
jgi:L-ribulose-5-phosphate 4-epimerase